jgi:hypothetical protein
MKYYGLGSVEEVQLSDALISLAIENISRTEFEQWVQKVLAKSEGLKFAPTGGIHDGGQDGFIRSVEGQATHFVQITKQEDTRTKVRETVESIRKKRKLEKLTLVTSKLEQNRDLSEAKWGREFGITLYIHDRNWLLVQASLDQKLRDELYGCVRAVLDEITKATTVKKQLVPRDRLSIVTYLEAQARSLPTSEDFQNLCLDTIIYTALQNTDPSHGIFKTIDELETEISQTHPKLISKSTNTLAERLEFLSSKNNLPRIRKHPGQRFALPYEVRNQFDELTLSMQHLEDSFIACLSARIQEEGPEPSSVVHGQIISIVRDTLHETFRQQAINFSNSYSTSNEDANIEVYSIIENLIKQIDIQPCEAEFVQSISAKIFRNVCYSSSATEARFLEILMKYYTILFIMDGDPVVSEFFSEMARRLRIYLGTDIIVRCLSETFVKEKSRGMTNTLKRIQEGGVKLRITRRTLEEVFSHLHTTYLTFKNDFESWYRNGSLNEFIQSDRILIRAFGYAYFEPLGHFRQPRDWSDFLNQFGKASWFADPSRDIDEFGSFLLEKFALEFVELEGMTSKIDCDLAQQIADEIYSLRDRGATSGYAKLALNDAQMALFINAERNELNERVTSDLYGYNTWWMTEETKIIHALKKRSLPSEIVMHPQFLINHLLLDQARKGGDNQGPLGLTPSLFGLRITDRVPQSTMKAFLNAVRDIDSSDEAAQRARIRSAANLLKKRGGR